ncbi:UbiX family flavin prenyltransferase [Candidatus Thorarchaeota archaeon]|nr:MAG: UbiX family flavin prenyltransferase [Candidatus Thorarchaeota archaeon]
MKRILVCITGASGAIYGVRSIEALNEANIEVHLVVSKWGKKTLQYETGVSMAELASKVHEVYDEENLAAKPASGSFHLDGMLIAPCSMKTLSSIANGFADNLVSRAADCSLKEKKPLVLVTREAPLNLIHIRNMEKVVEAGATLFPASPAFWSKPSSIEELVDSLVDRILTHLGINEETAIEWDGDI